MENIIKIKLCKVCGNSSEFHKFKGLVCCKCASRKNNERLNEKQYFKTYYENHIEEFKEHDAKYYLEAKKPLLLSKKLCL